MILVIANLAVEGAPALVNLFPAGAASLVTASDLHCSFKSCISVNDFPSSVLHVGGREIMPADITGVITTVPAFFPMEFYYVKPEDREYVCAETNAFFQYLLHELKCIKCNPPDHSMLSGGNAYKPAWIKTAASLAIPLLPFRTINGYHEPALAPSRQKSKRCTFIFDEIMDRSLPESVKKHTRTLAATLSLPYLDCYFSQDESEQYLLSHINTLPDIALSRNREKIADHFMKALT